MVLNVNTVGDNPQQPGVYAETYIPDQLIAGGLKLVTQPIVLAAGTLPRGSVLGRQSASSIIVTSGVNTGNGTVTLTSAGNNVKFGNYALVATSATNFTVTDPEGNVLPAATVGTAYSNSGINFRINAGGTAFIAGDSFTARVVNSIGNYILSVQTASDGSQVPSAILADYADASLGLVKTGAYVMGEFNVNALNYDPSWTFETLTAALQPYSIYLKETQGSYTATDPT